jgi:hypothetical protein
MSFSSVGLVFDLPSFRQHLTGLDMSWAKSVTIHHTGSPDLAARPKGFTIQHMRNIQSYYEGERKWFRGPHLFTDEDQIFGMSPLTARGTHAETFNTTSIGIEMLGNYDIDSPFEGRGREVLLRTAATTAAILIKLGLPANELTIHFHRDDPKTSKTCPGTKIEKAPFIALVKNAITAATAPAEKHIIPPAPQFPILTLASLEERIRKLEQLAAASNFP